MPTATGTTALGATVLANINQPTINNLILSFPNPTISALLYRKVGILRLAQIDAAGQVVVFRSDVEYPGSWVIRQSPAIPGGALFAIFECSRPGIPYSLFWN